MFSVRNAPVNAEFVCNPLLSQNKTSPRARRENNNARYDTYSVNPLLCFRRRITNRVD